MSCTFDCLWIILKCDVSNHRLLKPLWLESQRLSFNPDVQKRAFYVRIYILEENKNLPLPQSSSSEPSPQSSLPSQRFFSDTHLLFLHATCPGLHRPKKNKEKQSINKTDGRAWSESPSSIDPKRSSPQSFSSVLSPQSSTPSHFQNMGLHNPFPQVMASALHSGEETRWSPFGLVTVQRELVVKPQFVFDNKIGLTAVYFIT